LYLLRYINILIIVVHKKDPKKYIKKVILGEIPHHIRCPK
jgi:hypothetical protein